MNFEVGKEYLYIDLKQNVDLCASPRQMMWSI